MKHIKTFENYINEKAVIPKEGKTYWFYQPAADEMKVKILKRLDKNIYNVEVLTDDPDQKLKTGDTLEIDISREGEYFEKA